MPNVHQHRFSNVSELARTLRILTVDYVSIVSALVNDSNFQQGLLEIILTLEQSYQHELCGNLPPESSSFPVGG